MPDEPKVSDELERWLHSEQPKTIGGLVDVFGSGSFAVLFLMLMALPALPIPTGAVSHVLEVVTMLLALELCAGRDEVWLPERWKRRELKGASGPKFATTLLKRIRWFERFARRRLPHVLERRPTRVAFGAIVFGLALTAFFAPPFSGLDTLPSLGVVVLSLGMLLGDAAIAAGGLGIGALGVALVVGLGHAIGRLF